MQVPTKLIQATDAADQHVTQEMRIRRKQSNVTPVPDELWEGYK